MVHKLIKRKSALHKIEWLKNVEICQYEYDGFEIDISQEDEEINRLIYNNSHKEINLKYNLKFKHMENLLIDKYKPNRKVCFL